MNLKVSTAADSINESSGGLMLSSGIYDTVIKFASLAVSKNGAESVNFNCDCNGAQQTLYGPYITDKTGKTIDIGAKLINKLAIIAGMTDGDNYVIEQEEHVVGKDKLLEVFNVITNFSELAIKIRVQEEYSINPNTGEIQKRIVIKNFFSEAGASAEELVNGTEAGKRLALEQEKYASNITYKDNLTPEIIAEWTVNKSKKLPTASPTTAPKPTVAPTFKRTTFGGKE